MRKQRPLYAAITLVALTAVAAYVVWASYAGAKEGLGWVGLKSAWPYLLAGVFTVACVIAGFVRLAFFSEKRGYDDGADLNKH
jgi:hypothetical protein